ncbi:MAG: hypothetical protein AB1715_01220 [Acidobacteriota bacterium]
MRVRINRKRDAEDSEVTIPRFMEDLRTAAVALLLLALADCAVGPRAPKSLPAPPHPASRPGPWGTTTALYDPALFGPERPLAELVTAYGLRLRDGKLKDARLLLNKSQRRLELWVGRRMVKAFRIQMGQDPVGRKMRQGDSRTPEGEYFICDHRPSRYYLALWISYPNLDDARAGFEAGRITRRQLDEIAGALEKGECPPQDTRLGGLLLLHGQLPEHTAELARGQRGRPSTLRPGFQVGDVDPSKVREFYDWTDGCAGMFNPDIRELYEFIPDRTRLTIVANGPVTPPPEKTPKR